MNHPVLTRAPINESAALPEVGQYLTFMVADEVFGLNIRNIKEIIEYGHVTQVPMMPDFVKGVFNLRGNVVPVIDLAVRFQHAKSAINKRSCIVIVELQNNDERQDVGLVVDSVCEVLEIAAADIEPTPSFGVRIRTEFISGMGKVNGRFVIILDMNQVLSLDELAELGGAAGTPS